MAQGRGQRQRGCRGVCGGRRTSHCPWGLHRRWSLSCPHQTRALRIAGHLGEEQLLSHLLQHASSRRKTYCSLRYVTRLSRWSSPITARISAWNRCSLQPLVAETGQDEELTGRSGAAYRIDGRISPHWRAHLRRWHTRARKAWRIDYKTWRPRRSHAGTGDTASCPPRDTQRLIGSAHVLRPHTDGFGCLAVRWRRTSARSCVLSSKKPPHRSMTSRATASASAAEPGPCPTWISMTARGAWPRSCVSRVMSWAS